MKVPIPPYIYEFGNKTAFNTIFVICIGIMIAIIVLSLTSKNYTFAKNNGKKANET